MVKRKAVKKKKQKKMHLGGFEEIVILAILQLGENAYGVTIRQLIEKENRPASIGAVYTTLERLEGKGYVSSRQGEATAERGGRAKRYFRVEGAGIDALNETQRARARMFAGLGPEWETITG